MSCTRNEETLSARPVRHLWAAGLFLATLLFALSLSISARAQDVYSSRGSSDWDKAPVRGTGNPCQQAERWIDGRWATSQNGSCVGDDRSGSIIRPAGVKPYDGNSSDPIVRPAGVQPPGGSSGDPIVRPPGVSAPTTGRRSNGYLGLTQQQAAGLQAQQGRINGSRDATIFNGLAKEKGIPTYKAGPQDSNVGQNFGFGQSGKPRNNNTTGYASGGRAPTKKGGDGTSYGRNYGGVQY